MAFLEEQLTLKPAYSSGMSEAYSVDIHETRNGYEYVVQRHPLPRLQVDFVFQNRSQSDIIETLHDLFHRAGGNVDGFRVKNLVDYTTNAYDTTPTSNDQECTLLTAEGATSPIAGPVYQMWRWYGTYGQSGATRRRILKPVSGTTVVGIRNGNVSPSETVALTAGWSVDTTNGQIQLSTNKSTVITGITKAAQAVVSVPATSPDHGIVAGQSVYFSGVLGMLQVNNRRVSVVSATAGSITVDLDTTSFSTFSSGSPLGTLNTNPQSGELLTAGCEFDIPMRFADPSHAAIFASRNPDYLIMGSNISLIEILNT